MNTDHFKFSYELNDEFFVFPTIVATKAARIMLDISDAPGMPEFNPMKLVHGTEDIFFEKPMLAGKQYVC